MSSRCRCKSDLGRSIGTELGFLVNEGVKAASFINNRARLSIDYKRSDLEIKMSAQHVGVWGQDPQIDKNGRFVLNEAWAKLDFGHGLFAQLGRQALVL